MRVKRPRGLFLLLFSLISGGNLCALTISDDAAKTVPIVLPQTEVTALQDTANELAEKLKGLFGKPFPIETSEEIQGIVLGTVKSHPEFAARLKRDEPGAAEGYLIRSDASRILIIGAGPLGVQNGCWDLLARLGYRHYFPSGKWEILPRLKSADLSIDVVEFPAYATREIFMGYGIDQDRADQFAAWKRHNRLEYSFPLKSGHSYTSIIARNRAEFEQHPEYLVKPLEEIKSTGKFVIANEGLRKLVLADSVRLLEKDPRLECISLDPSDGGGWPEDSPLGSVSNQVVTLANETAAALREAVPGKKVGIYAYNEHSPAPSIRIDRDVIVSVATSFIRNGRNFDVIMRDWRDQGATLGVRDYFAVWAWDNDLPGKSLAASPAKTAGRIALCHELGARYYIAETSDSWAPNGLGHYVAAKALWDPGVKDRLAEIRQDFLAKSFGTAAEAMRRFYDLIDGSNRPLLSEHLLGGMYLALQDAYTSTREEAVLARIDDLAAYTRYVELYRRFSNIAKADARQAAYEELTQFGARIRESGMVHVRALFRDPPIRDKDLVFKEQTATEAGRSPLERAELRALVATGVQANKLLNFETKNFGNDLVPLPEEGVSTEKTNRVFSLRGRNTLYTYVARKGDAVGFTIQSHGMGKDGELVKVRIFPVNHPLGESIADLEIPADKLDHEESVVTEFGGLHRIEIDDGGNVTSFTPRAGQPFVLAGGGERPASLFGRYSLYFFVPKGTRVVTGFISHPAGKIRDAGGREVLDLSRLPASDYFQTPVPPGQDGRVWKLDQGLGSCLLMNVPPFFALERQSLLTPKNAIQ